MARLGDYIEQIRGVSYKPTDLRDFQDENSVLLLRANNIQDGNLNLDDVIYVSKNKIAEKQYLKKGDILICTSSGSKELVGKAAYVKQDIPISFGAFCKVVRPKTECKKYIGHFFQSPYYRRSISDLSAGANINNIRNEHIGDLEIQLPPLEEQRRIAALLDKVSDLIAKRRAQLDKLDLLVKARFVEMFGDCYTNPYNLPIAKWNDIFNTTTGKLDSNASVENGEYPFFTCSKEILKIDKYAFDQEALLLAGNNAAGKYDVKYYKGKFNAYQRTYVLSLKQNWSYALFKFQLEDKLGYLEQQSLGGLTKYLTLKILNELEFIIPGKLEQDKFATFVKQIEKSKLTIQTSLDKLEILKKALMQQYFG